MTKVLDHSALERGTLKLNFAADHPAAQGHFPGNPIIPGAVLLAAALRAVGAALGRELSHGVIASAKFPSPSRPGDCVDVSYSVSDGRVSLDCSVAERPVLKAKIACGVAVATARTLIDEPAEAKRQCVSGASEVHEYSGITGLIHEPAEAKR